MLVLSRRPNEKIVFPSINAIVQIVGVKPGVVRLGIDAPPDVPVFRHEVLQRPSVDVPPARPPTPASAHEEYEVIRNRLTTARAHLQLLRRRLNADYDPSVEAVVDAVERQITTLEHYRTDCQEQLHRSRSEPNKGRRTLLVEQNPNERALLAGVFRLAGFAVTTAGDGAHALDYLRTEGKPDVLLLNMLLGSTHGSAACVESAAMIRSIRANPDLAGLKIFAVAASPEDRCGLEQGPGGIDRWFQKPLNPETMLREIQAELATAESIG